ncbi:MAG: hypothetical protein WBR18_05275 [Anaerolineales bacterium]
MKRTLSRSMALEILDCLPAACEDQATALPTEAGGIVFAAERFDLQPRECTLLRWKVTGGSDATLNGQSVPLLGQEEVCPPETLVYEPAADLGTRVEPRRLEITVSGGVGPDDPVAPGVPPFQGGSWVSTGGPPGGLGFDIHMRPG